MSNFQSRFESCGDRHNSRFEGASGFLREIFNFRNDGQLTQPSAGQLGNEQELCQLGLLPALRLDNQRERDPRREYRFANGSEDHWQHNHWHRHHCHTHNTQYQHEQPIAGELSQPPGSASKSDTNPHPGSGTNSDSNLHSHPQSNPQPGPQSNPKSNPIEPAPAGKGEAAAGSPIYNDGASFFVSATGNDKGDGSREHPFATLQRAAQAMEKSSVKTTTIEAGNYSMKDTLHLGAADSGVTFQYDKAGGPDSAVFNGGNKIDRMIDIEGGSHITINGLRLTDFRWTGIFNHGGTVDRRDKVSKNVGAAQANRFINNEIDHNTQIGDWTVGAAQASAAIVDDQVTPDTLIANNYVHDLAYMGMQVGRSSDLESQAGDY
ncbi:MAG TPA: hypothetical protein V6C72_09415, partial [Chroococcales cyanobacterium]